MSTEPNATDADAQSQPTPNAVTAAKRKVKLYVPTDPDRASTDAAQSVIDDLIRRFSDRYGGATAYDARGCWVNPDGEVYDEPVKIVEALADAPNEQAIEADAEEVRDRLDEEAVLFELESTDAAFV